MSVASKTTLGLQMSSTSIPPFQPFPSVFPTEIYEDIITLIHEDRDDGRWRVNLCCCALVSHLWLPWSQRCLYRAIEFTGASEVDSHRLEILLRTLRDSPHLRLCVREFRFREAPLPSQRHYSASWPQKVRLWPVLAAGRLPNLRDLRFTGGGLRRTFCPHPSSFAALTTFRTVTKLRLAMMGFTFTLFFRMLSCLPSLEDVMIHKLSWDDLDRSFPPQSESPLRRRTSLRALRILDRLGLLFGFDCPYTADYARCLWQIIGSFQMTMNTLSLDSFSLYDLQHHSQELPGAFPILHFPQLHSLTLGYDVIRQYDHFASPAGLLDFFRRLDMPVLSTVNLVVHLDRDSLEQFLDGPHPADVFIDPAPDVSAYAIHLSSLRSVNVLYLLCMPSEEPQGLDDSEATNDSTASAPDADAGLSARKDLMDRYLIRAKSWLATSPLYRRGILTVRGAVLG
ncbi:hypothetical protein L226DRAFT_265685 [Lentinus tigrinus ALCF2SS1-7]|uniref:F-box domain-containing protein n=1 Tax=Lentinus tigrinus ALCF2SS1-6 TaxID=1328759 RepID=A0A5C2S718_9APHY|nr:hypothetical protein L227DRAFT_178511 [Lentinus tigrinus ALCF2SS1-6]RPD69840.1 hypothetical protein L226DRAFT_265685 [Lentinus tigrinus ALCF2SS1-7]